jgi:hypothetical protein
VGNFSSFELKDSVAGAGADTGGVTVFFTFWPNSILALAASLLSSFFRAEIYSDGGVLRKLGTGASRF